MEARPIERDEWSPMGFKLQSHHPAVKSLCNITCSLTTWGGELQRTEISLSLNALSYQAGTFTECPSNSWTRTWSRGGLRRSIGWVLLSHLCTQKMKVLIDPQSKPKETLKAISHWKQRQRKGQTQIPYPVWEGSLSRILPFKNPSLDTQALNTSTISQTAR